MTYSFASHIETLITPVPTAISSFALIDAAQLDFRSKSLRALLSRDRTALLFEETFAKTALNLSPVLIELQADADMRTQQIIELDRACQHVPVMAILCSPASFSDLTLHLRSVLLVDAERVPYLLRFADTQMLAAANAIFTPRQRACFFQPTAHWFVTDHEGKLADMASAKHYPHALPASSTPLCFEEIQIAGLLTAAAAPILASQLRHLDAEFRNSLGHAEQVGFSAHCIAAAALEGVEIESNLLAFAASRWQASALSVETAS